MIPNACDRAAFDVPAAAGDEIRAGLGIAPGAPLIVYAGAFGAVNGVEWLADVAAEMRSLRPDARFLRRRARCRDTTRCCDRARARGVLDETLFVRPPMPKREIPALLAAATVATSLFRPIPEMESNSANKFFDALAAGRPVAINYGGWHRHAAAASAARASRCRRPIRRQRRRSWRRCSATKPPSPAAARRRAALAADQFDRDLLAEEFAGVLERVAGVR